MGEGLGFVGMERCVICHSGEEISRMGGSDVDFCSVSSHDPSIVLLSLFSKCQLE